MVACKTVCTRLNTFDRLLIKKIRYDEVFALNVSFFVTTVI